ncbi:MAG: CNNM domain-containing protein, partial [Bifidobacterium psychraerophilum]
MSLWLNIVLIVVFLVIGAVFSGTELALVSLRGSQVERMEQEDARGARVGKIARDPNTFLSTVQIGVTLSGFLSSSVGASSIAPFLIPVFERWGVPTNLASPLVTVVLTIVIAYFSIVISELVPKRIAMQRAEQIARAAVPAIDIFSRICRPLIWLIGKNTNGIVRLLGFDPQQAETQVSDDELRVLVSSNTRLSKDERTIL